MMPTFRETVLAEFLIVLQFLVSSCFLRHSYIPAREVCKATNFTTGNKPINMRSTESEWGLKGPKNILHFTRNNFHSKAKWINEYTVSLWDDEKLLEIVVTVAQ